LGIPVGKTVMNATGPLFTFSTNSGDFMFLLLPAHGTT
jgi:hypothetical protein